MPRRLLAMRPCAATMSGIFSRTQPDFVLNMSFHNPKLTRYPTYGFAEFADGDSDKLAALSAQRAEL